MPDTFDYVILFMARQRAPGSVEVVGRNAYDADLAMAAGLAAPLALFV